MRSVYLYHAMVVKDLAITEGDLSVVLDLVKFGDTSILDCYQEWVWKTTTPKEGDNGGWWACSGMVAEAGESLALFEKAYRKNLPVDKDKLADEIGDVLWFLAATCNMMEIDLADVLEHNVLKINKRQADGKITSEG